MRFSFLRQLVSPSEPWMIDPLWAQMGKQLLQGVLRGFEFEPEKPQMDYFLGNRECHSIPQGKNVHVVNLTGFMFRDDAECGQLGTRTLAVQLLTADADNKTVGHILYVDSGGGRSDSVPDLADAIRKCKKPVVAYCDGTMCSAAMYAASFCASIISHREEDRVGCIGTMIEFADYPKFAKLESGQVNVRVYADCSTEKNEDFEKALEGDFQLLKERVLNPSAEKFRSDMRTNRQNVNENHLLGRTYQAGEVIGSLVDSIGDFDSAIEKVISLSNLNIQKMEGLENIQALPSCRDLQSVDGTVTLNGDQLNEIDAAIGNQAANDELTQARANVASLTEERDNLRSQVTERENRISELQGTIDQLNARPIPAANPSHNGNHVVEAGDNDNPEEYCKNLIREINGY